jgi:serine/threonine protein kinase
MSSQPPKHDDSTTNVSADHETSATQEHFGSTFSDREVHSDSVAFSLDLSHDDVQQAAQAIHFLSDVRAAMRQIEIGNEAEAQSSPADMPAKLAGYRIIRTLGRGGFAEVFLAHDDVLDRPAALKIPLIFGGHDDYFRRRFEKEGRAAAMLAHPQIVPVYEYGSVGPLSYIAYAWVDGENLEHWKSNTRAQSDSSGLSRDQQIREAAEIVAALATAIEHAHQRGVIHRDLKPSNILVDNAPCTKGLQIKDRLRITDFGLAFQWGHKDGRLTTVGTTLGTPAYMSPEQAVDSSSVNHTTDIWALGIMLVELLTGRSPFDRGTPRETLEAVKQDELPSLRKIDGAIPRDLEAICQKCLQKLPSDRYGSALALANDLNAWLRNESVQARPVSSITRLRRWTSRNPVVATSLAVTFVSLALATSITTWKWRDAERNLNKAVNEHSRANTNLTGLTDVVDNVLDYWTESGSPDELTQQQKAVLTQILDTERSLLAANQGHTALNLSTLKSFRRVAELQAKLGQYQESIQSCNDGMQLMLVNTTQPTPAHFVHDKVKLMLLKGEDLFNLDKPDEAIEVAKEIQKLLSEEIPLNSDPQLTLYMARAQTLAGRSWLHRGDAGRAEKQLELALKLLESKDNTKPDVDWQIQIATSSTALAGAQFQQTRYLDSYESAKKSLAILTELHQQQEGSANNGRKLAETHIQAARILAVIHSWPVVIEHLQKAQLILELSLKGEVQLPSMVNLYRQSLVAHAEALFNTKRVDEASKKLEQCLSGSVPFSGQSLSANITQVRALALAARIRDATKDVEAARRNARESAELAEQALSKHSMNTSAQVARLAALSLDFSFAEPEEALQLKRYAGIASLAKTIDELSLAREERIWVWKTCAISLARQANYLAEAGDLNAAVRLCDEINQFPIIPHVNSTFNQKLEAANAVCKLLNRFSEPFAGQPEVRQYAVDQVILNLENAANQKLLKAAILAEERWKPVSEDPRFKNLLNGLNQDR